MAKVPSITEIAAWDEIRTHGEIRSLLPADVTFSMKTVDRHWVAKFFRGEEVLWVQEGMACNVLLFDAYGWIRIHLGLGLDRQARGAWQPRRDVLPTPRVKSADVADPGDLDPGEVTDIARATKD